MAAAASPSRRIAGISRASDSWGAGWDRDFEAGFAVALAAGFAAGLAASLLREAAGVEAEARAELPAFLDRSDFIHATAWVSERWPFSSGKIVIHFP